MQKTLNSLELNMFNKKKKGRKMKYFMLFLCGLLLACSSRQEKPVVNVKFCVAEDAPADGLLKYSLNETGQIFYLHPAADLSRNDIKAATVNNSHEKYFVDVTFTETGAQKFAKLTGENTGKRIAIILNNELVTAPVVRDTIKQGKAIITGNFSKKEAEKIAKGIVGAVEL